MGYLIAVVTSYLAETKDQSDTIKEYRFECANDKKHIFIVPITFMEKTSD